MKYKVSLSYSKTSPEHEKWVKDLADRLLSNGIDSKYDKWDLNPGQDKYAFLESIISDKTLDKVLIICDRGYKDNADKRINDGGYVTQIISPIICSALDQGRFVPIIAEKGEMIDSFVPDILKSRMPINMSSRDVYESGYEELIRLIAGRPKDIKPVSGSLPSYLNKESSDRKRFIYSQVTAEGFFDFNSIYPPYDLDEEGLNIQSEIFIGLCLPHIETIESKKPYRFLSVTAICSTNTLSAKKVLVEELKPYEVRILEDLKLDKLRTDEKERVFWAVGKALAYTFSVTIAIPGLMLKIGKIDAKLAYRSIIDLFLLPMLGLHIQVGFDKLHLVLSKVGRPFDENDKNNNADAFLLKTVKNAANSFYKNKNIVKFENEDNKQFDFIIDMGKVINKASNVYYNNGENGYIQIIEGALYNNK